ncbi:hypothetical protein NDU88_006265 [Pleurodeles waltl]|uniref:Uncharacterized protein n=1 Tax=Pleurodeles waltl TaxID=8319 RepID=A0AAV7LQ18_PLEWA|nr:hypothetical protein NDU88_006265 [Pleurodeles waltl]
MSSGCRDKGCDDGLEDLDEFKEGEALLCADMEVPIENCGHVREINVEEADVLCTDVREINVEEVARLCKLLSKDEQEVR